MINDSGPHEVISTLVTLIDCLQQEHHILEELPSVVPVANLVNAFHDDLIDYLSRVPVDQSDPGVYDVSLHSELDIDCF
jgi:hypothetical protein